MSKFSNETNIPLSVAIWLATDNYQHPPDDGKKYISATGLMKSVRQIVLGNRLVKGDGSVSEPILGRVASRFGTAIHDGIEMSWMNNYAKAMEDLGYPPGVIDRIRINPEDPGEEGIIPVYMEQRFFKEVGDWTVSGQFDFVGDGRLEDFKSTTTFVYQNNLKDDDYVKQGSIYRWGRPDIITQDEMAIQFIFKDWQKFKIREPNYPSAILVEKVYPLNSEQDTDRWIKKKLSLIDTYSNTPEGELPLCTPDELWQKSASVWKYYKDPAKRSRATKNFDSQGEANLRYVKDGSVGIVIEVKPEPTACRYCSAFATCSQKDGYIASGELKV